MSQQKLLLSLIESLSESELYDVAKYYLREVEGIENPIVCNGPWDSGIDISTTSFEIQVQATVEHKNFEKKFFVDIAKAKINSDKKNLTNKVRYFYAHPISNTLLLQYKNRARNDYNIFVDIIEANRLAETSTEFRGLAQLLYDLSNLEQFQKESSYFDNVKVKAYYDLMSFGKVTDIKYNIIKSFILNYLFNNQSTTKEVLLLRTNDHFSSTMDDSYFVSVLARLSSEQKIKSTKEEVILLEKERERIKTVLQNYKIEEGLLVRDISEALKKQCVEVEVDEVIKLLSELYESTYNINISELTYKESTFSDVKTITQKIKDLIADVNPGHLEENEIDSLVKLLVRIADSSDLLPRIAAGHVYSKVSDPDRLQRYVNQNLSNKTIFLDANVILNLILVDYENEANYNSFNYMIANQFYSFYKKNGLILKTIKNYTWEIAAIFKDAVVSLPKSWPFKSRILDQAQRGR